MKQPHTTQLANSESLRPESRIATCRLIVDLPAPGTWNMAVDEALLADAIENGIATLRLYEWSEPTLSLGYFQRYEDRHQHAPSRNAASVRRQSGGGAILHDRELTYSLTLPAAHPFARHAEQLYTTMHEAVIAVLASHVSAATSGWKLQLRSCDECASITAADAPFLCFQRKAAGDLLLVRKNFPSDESTSPSCKILGSAQRRRQGAILQHGSLLLETSPAAPELPGVNNLTGTSLTAADVSAALANTMRRALRIDLEESKLPEDRRVLAAELETRKYGVPSWTKRR
jgi:lipoyl(octanoyl) transferase